MKINTDKRKVMILGGEEELVCEDFMDGTQLECVSELKYFGCILSESGTGVAERRRKEESGMKGAVAMRWRMFEVCVLSVPG